MRRKIKTYVFISLKLHSPQIKGWCQSCSPFCPVWNITCYPYSYVSTSCIFYISAGIFYIDISHYRSIHIILCSIHIINCRRSRPRQRYHLGISEPSVHFGRCYINYSIFASVCYKFCSAKIYSCSTCNIIKIT